MQSLSSQFWIDKYLSLAYELDQKLIRVKFSLTMLMLFGSNWWLGGLTALFEVYGILLLLQDRYANCQFNLLVQIPNLPHTVRLL